ncbi:MAG TPA: hypothetical protein VFP61_09095 [Acidimicrobiales bacterium]|nr:hypothetical protein [Acidimicrobiales bacterium]
MTTMSRTVDLFIDHDDLHQLLTHLGAAVHRPPTPIADHSYAVHLADGLLGELRPTARRADGTPRFASFTWQLAALSPGGCPAGDDPVTIAVRIVADELRRQRLRCLLVVDLHHERGAAAPGSGAGAPSTDGHPADGQAADGPGDAAG